MKKASTSLFSKTFMAIALLLFSTIIFAQSQPSPQISKSDFWEHVRFGGAFGLNVGGGFTNVVLAPSAIYNFNNYFSAGAGLQGSYVSVKNNYNSLIYGASIIGLANPIEEIQFSVELEELKVNTSFETSYGIPSKHFWNTGLFLGAGYRADNVTIGARYNVLFNKNDFVYDEAFMPFIRVYF